MAIAKSSPAAKLAFAAIIAVVLFSGSADGRGMVGGRSEIGDVKTNKEVQELGRFSVEEYNRRRIAEIQRGRIGGDGDQLRFLEVVEAQRQVVSGIKYFLKVEAIPATEMPENGGELTRTFESVVVVKPWLKSKQLLGFAPSDDRGVVH